MTAAMNLSRGTEHSSAGVVPPPESRRAGIWDRPIPGGGRAPLVWLLGVHGGAGASSLTNVLAPAADSGRRWPGVFDRESPFVVLVARETIAGLTRAHDLLRQHHSGFAGPSQVLGLITVASRPGRMAAEIRRYRDVVGSLSGHLWRVPWYEEWTLVEPEKLPVWTPGAMLPQRRRKVDPFDEVPLEVHEIGADIVAAARSVLAEAASSQGRSELVEE